LRERANAAYLKELEQMFKALADITRLKIMQMICQNEMCVLDMFKELNMSQPAVSHHLKVLKQAGLIDGRKTGKWVYYSINESKREILNFLCNNLTVNKNYI